MLHQSRISLYYRFCCQLLATMACALMVSDQALALDKPQYDVVHTAGKVEYRRYQPYIVAETTVDENDDYNDAANEGFQRLFNYISGANREQTKIAMTAPVQQVAKEDGRKIAMTAPVQQSATPSGWVVSFMLPHEFTLNDAPIPTDPRVQLRAVPGRLMAVLRYSGRWTERNFEKQRSRLTEQLQNASIKTLSKAESAVYNPPFMPPFLRRNEVMFEVASFPQS